MALSEDIQIHVCLRWDLVQVAVLHLLADYHVEPVAETHAITLDVLPDLVITDEVRLKRLQKQASYRKYAVPILVVTTIDSPLFVKLTIKHGIRGYLCLQDQLQKRLLTAVQEILDGSTYLSPTAAKALDRAYIHDDIYSRITPYHLHVLYLMGQHRRGIEIANLLKRSPTAIHKIQQYLRDLFDASSNGELVSLALDYGLISSPSDFPIEASLSAS
ncbi:MAG: response regulator transcription factor [Anaerolineae bacterium]|nr:response regulator transcription factor [Anaerolineae bacterium]MCA9889611.1 response regulator transcription factor [Anaerolineae bacterium]MCA9891433.1 response regulator transcription factor [Anaerolineae bacterium]